VGEWGCEVESGNIECWQFRFIGEHVDAIITEKANRGVFWGVGLDEIEEGPGADVETHGANKHGFVEYRLTYGGEKALAADVLVDFGPT